MMEMLNPVFKTAQLGTIDRYTIEHEPIKSIDLMERAARNFTKKMLKKFPEFRKFCIVAGRGNNGGDGFAIARLLQEKGLRTRVCLIACCGLSSDCEINRNRWKGDCRVIEKPEEIEFEEEELIVDAIFGSGLNRKVEGLAAEIIGKINESPNVVIAVDIPSGLMGEDNSRNEQEAIIRADYTFTFQFPKLAFMFPENYPFVGEWEIVDIGLCPEIVRSLPTDYFYLSEDFISGLLPRPGKFAHKGTNGHGLLIVGSSGMMGAAVLAAKAARRSGIGLLSCHIPAQERAILQTTVPEALIKADRSKKCFSGIDRLDPYTAIAVGPGIGKAPETVEGIKKLLARWKGKTIWDADALNILAENKYLLDFLPEESILTPHPKEFERLAGKSENDFERLNKLSIFANHYRVYVLLKGAHTVIASPCGKCWFNTSGNPGMAKGGMGDVLTGVLLGLVGSGIPPLEAALIGVYAHGLAADLLAAENGKRGVCAEEVAEGLGKAWHILERGKETGKRGYKRKNNS